MCVDCFEDYALRIENKDTIKCPYCRLTVKNTFQMDTYNTKQVILEIS